MNTSLATTVVVLGIGLSAFGAITGPFPFTQPPPTADDAGVPEGLSGGDWASIRQVYQARRHAVVSNADGTHQARNPGQGWLTRFDDRGFTVKPDAADWEWGLELSSYGYAGHEIEVAGGTTAVAGGGKLVRFVDGKTRVPGQRANRSSPDR